MLLLSVGRLWPYSSCSLTDCFGFLLVARPYLLQRSLRRRFGLIRPFRRVHGSFSGFDNLLVPACFQIEREKAKKAY